MGGKQRESADERVLNLAEEICNARETQIPRLLLQIQGILDSHPSGSKELRAVKEDIWHYDLLHFLVPSLKQDYNKQPQGWSTAAKLAHILSHCCVGLVTDDPNEFKDVFLPDATDQMLTLARRLQTKHCKTPSALEDTKKELLDYMKMVLQAVNYVCMGHDFLTVHVFKSPWLLKLVMEEEDAPTCCAALSTVQNIHRIKPGLCGLVEEAVVHSIVDEMVHKITTSLDVQLAGSCVKTVLVMCTSHPPVVDLLLNRYKGLKLMLGKWRGRGFGNDLRQMLLILESGSIQRAEEQRLHEAARTVQAMWKSYATRKKLKKAGQAIAVFQRSFRKRREVEEEHKRNEAMKRDLELFLLQQRKRAMRNLQMKQLETLEILPAKAVSKHLSNEQTRAALKIQAQWRGHSTRSSMKQRRSMVQQTRAAIRIQRYVRRWLERVRAARQEPPGWQRPPGLTDERRVQLHDLIVERRITHTPAERTREQAEELHDNVQNMLRLHVTSAKQRRKKEQHREALLGRLELDAQLIMNAQPLVETDPSEMENFVCHSVPIATKARKNHSEELRLLKQPWWKKLGDEYQDAKEEEEAENWKVF